MPDFSGMLRWPNVPACYGWLSLDRRGQWRMRGETVTHRGLNDFLNRQYARDAAGNYFVQNGPQRVYVALDYTPWVVHLTAAGGLETHVGESVDRVLGVSPDDEGNLLFDTAGGVALLCDRDLPSVIDHLQRADGSTIDEATLLAAVEKRSVDGLYLHWQNQRLPMKSLLRREVPQHFGFVPLPQPSEANAKQAAITTPKS